MVIDNKIYGKIGLFAAALSAFFVINVSSARAQEQVEGLQITCEQGETQCTVEPSRTDPLFDEDNLYPGEEVTRQIEVTNNRDEVCYFSIDEFSDVEDSLADSESGLRFSDVLFTKFLDGEESTEEVSFTELFESSTPVYLGELTEGEQKPFDWWVRFDSDAGNEYQGVDLIFDFDWTFQCGEEPEDEVERIVSLEKTNDSLDMTKFPDDEVVYEISYSTGDAPVYNAVVIDLPPEDFMYMLGSWEVVTDWESAFDYDEPVYDSPGVWNLGTVPANSTVTLSYTAEISEDVEPGDYPDLAYAWGTVSEDSDSRRVYANEDADSYFVSTEVAVAAEEDSPKVKAAVSEEEVEVEERVLGEAVGLPATGADNIWAKIVLATFGLGVFLVLLGTFFPVTLERSGPSGGIGVIESSGGKDKQPAKGKPFGFLDPERLRNWRESIKKNKGKFWGILIFGLVTFAFPRQAFAEDLIIRLQEPESPTSQDSIKLNFVALDTGDREITVRCFQSKPGVLGFSQFGSDIKLDAGGDSGYCQVGSGVLSTAGTYKFYVEASAEGSDPVESEEVLLEYDPNDPDDPKYIEKESEGCKDLIEIEVADDGETSRIRVYRSKDTEFEANSETEIRNIEVDPGKTVEFSATRPDCDKTYYYAVIAYDEAGNRSDVVTETIEKEITVTVEEEAEAEEVEPGEAQVLPAEDEGEARPLEEEGVVEGEVAEGEEEEEAGEVAGLEVEEEQEEAAARSPFVNFLTRGGWIILVVLAGAVVYIKRSLLKK